MIKKILIFLFLLILFPKVHGVYTKELSLNLTLSKIYSRFTLDGFSVRWDGSIEIGLSISNIFESTEGIVNEVVYFSNLVIFSTMIPCNLYVFIPSKGFEKIAEFPEHGMITKLKVLDNKLYILTGVPGAIYEYNGVTFNKIAQIEQYIWDIFKFNNSIYILTGLPATIQKLKGNSIQKIFSSSSEKHFLTSYISGNEVYIGTSGTGILYKFTKDEKMLPFISLGKNDITGIWSLGEKVYISTYKLNITKQQDQEETSKTQHQITLSQPPSGGIYRLISNRIDTIIYPEGISSFVIQDGKIFAASEKGIVEIDLSSPGTWKIHFPGKGFIKITQSLSKNSFLVSGMKSGFLGVAYFYSQTNTLISPEIEIKNVARWGKVKFDYQLTKDSKILTFLKGGNTPIEDETWSDWFEVKNNEVQNFPNYQFIKFKIIAKVLNKISIFPIIRKISLFYTPFNTSPQIDKFSYRYSNTVLELFWNASDQEGDKLSFDLYVKDTFSTSWLKLNKDRITNHSFQISKKSLGDGFFDFMIIASDTLSNPSELTLSSQAFLENIAVDTLPPIILDQKILTTETNRRTKVDFTIKDNTSIKEVSYSLDGISWDLILPNDGVLDDPIENFSILVNQQETNSFVSILIRAEDNYDNIIVQKIGPLKLE